jgi:DegV family protein with EDD domain
VVEKILGSLLQIKPIIKLEEGKLSVSEKVRTEKKALSKITDYLAEAFSTSTIKELYILHGTNVQQAKELVAELREKYPSIPINPYPLSTSVAVHAGVNTIGISWYND